MDFVSCYNTKPAAKKVSNAAANVKENPSRCPFCHEVMISGSSSLQRIDHGTYVEIRRAHDFGKCA